MSKQNQVCPQCLSESERTRFKLYEAVVQLSGGAGILITAFFLASLSTDFPRGAKLSLGLLSAVAFAVAGIFKFLIYDDVYHFNAGGQTHYHWEKNMPRLIGGQWCLDYGEKGGLVRVDGKIIRFRVNLNNNDGNEIINRDQHVSGVAAAWRTVRCRTAEPTHTCTLLDTAGYGVVIPISHVLATINNTTDMLEFGSRYTTYTDYLGEAIGRAIAVAESSKGTQRSKVAAAMREPLESVLKLFPPDRREAWLRYGQDCLPSEPTGEDSHTISGTRGRS